MFFDILLYGSLAVFGLGLLIRMRLWFTGGSRASLRASGPQGRVGSALRGLVDVLFSARLLTLLKALFLDVLLQRRTIRESPYRWAMHMLISWGFTLLLLMHALEAWVSRPLFPDYASTVNPYFFLRGVFGLMVLLGVLMAAVRRRPGKVPRLRTTATDRYVLVLVAVLILSGFFLEGAKILSYSDFKRMVAEYGDSDDEGDMKALEAYWVEELGVFSPRMQGPFAPDLLKKGFALHEMSCQNCHSASEAAFVGYGLSRVMRPMAGYLEAAGAVNLLWTLHILACFLGLAYLPFSKMFHILATPLSLLCNAVMDRERSLPANIATRQMLELDACARCGTCSLRCSSAPAFEAMGNPAILPSERLQLLRRLYAGKGLSEKDMEALEEGSIICTNCDRCTVVCPSGICLKDLWSTVREALLQARGEGQPLLLSSFSFPRGLFRERVPATVYEASLLEARACVRKRWDPEPRSGKDVPIVLGAHAAHGGEALRGAETFFACFGCRNCTTVCPVVALHEDPGTELGLLPHQIMVSLGLGLTALACSSGMLWACTTCYACQEHCPQKVEVTDILYALKSLALRGPREAGGPSRGWEEAA